MKALVIGGTGMVGPGVVRALQDRDVEPVVLHRGATETRFERPVRRVRGDRRDPASVRSALERFGVETVIDLACFGPEDARALADSVGPGHRVVMISSVAAYGPLRDGGPLVETRPCHPITAYGRAKLDADRALREALPAATIVRLGACFRAGDNLDGQLFEDAYWLRNLTEGGPTLLADGGAARWNLVHADDAGRAIVGLADCDEAVGETVLVGSRSTRTWREQHEIVAAGLGRELRVVATDAAWLRSRISDREFLDEMSLWDQSYDLSKLGRLLPGYRERVDLAEALVRTAESIVGRGALGDPELAREERRLAEAWVAERTATPRAGHSSITTG